MQKYEYKLEELIFVKSEIEKDIRKGIYLSIFLIDRI
jgi:hypothetical protein